MEGARQLADQMKQHQAEVDGLQEVIKKSAEDRAAEEERYQLAIKKINEHYQTTLAGIETKKADEVEQILHDYGSDPGAIATKLSELTGYEVYTVPEITVKP